MIRIPLSMPGRKNTDSDKAERVSSAADKTSPIKGFLAMLAKRPMLLWAHPSTPVPLIKHTARKSALGRKLKR